MVCAPDSALSRDLHGTGSRSTIRYWGSDVSFLVYKQGIHSDTDIFCEETEVLISSKNVDTESLLLGDIGLETVTDSGHSTDRSPPPHGKALALRRRMRPVGGPPITVIVGIMNER